MFVRENVAVGANDNSGSGSGAGRFGFAVEEVIGFGFCFGNYRDDGSGNAVRDLGD